MAECLFCRIVRREVPARIVDEDDDTLVFEDIDPQAPVHLLVVPKAHVASANELAGGGEAIGGKLLAAAARVARARGFADSGWRAVVNTGADAHQLVFHVHLHVLAGRPMRWPPG